MIPQTTVTILGIDELRTAIKRNPQAVARSAKTFFTRGIAVYRGYIQNSPWRVGGTGGGSPVSNDPRYPRAYQRTRSGNLRDTHRRQINAVEGKIYPTAPYAGYVHGGTRRMRPRPWLDYAKKAGDREIETLYRGMLKEIVADLAK